MVQLMNNRSLLEVIISVLMSLQKDCFSAGAGSFPLVVLATSISYHHCCWMDGWGCHGCRDVKVSWCCLSYLRLAYLVCF